MLSLSVVFFAQLFDINLTNIYFYLQMVSMGSLLYNSSIQLLPLLIFRVIIMIIFQISLKCVYPRSTEFEEPSSLHAKQVYIHGDVILGGLFTIHESCSQAHSEELLIKRRGPKTHSCGDSLNKDAFLDAVAMVAAVKEINLNKSLLPGINIGVDIKDTCQSVNTAVQEFLGFSFVKKHLKDTFSCPLQPEKNETRQRKKIHRKLYSFDV